MKAREVETGRRPLVVGNKIYMICDACGSLVRLNKAIIGSFHICVEDTSNNPTKPTRS